MDRTRSSALFEESRRFFPGGVNSPVRAFNGVGGEPFFAASGQGPYVFDADGNRYIDYVLSWGPLALGHAHPSVVDAVRQALEKGSSFGIPTETETRLAEAVQRHFPMMERMRFVSSGTEAGMSAIRLARGYTGRDLVVKMEGCYHGHVDGLLVKAGSGLTTLGVPTSPGVPARYAECTLTVPYNDLDAIRTVFEVHPGKIAALAMEPVPGNMGLVLPDEGYLQAVRDLTREHGVLLLFDEVMTGFRVALGGVQGLYGITPDLTMLGKVVGGGMPLAAYGGSAEVMAHVSPDGPVYQAGTLSGNPLATTAGRATIEGLEQPGVFDGMAARFQRLCDGLEAIAKEAGVPVYGTRLGTMGGFFFHDGPVRNYADATASDTDRYAKYFWGMLERGVYLAPSQFEAAFFSAAHDDAMVDATLEAARGAMAEL